eukprot:12066313-Prorocentrum_lima.AAC.1
MSLMTVVTDMCSGFASLSSGENLCQSHTLASRAFCAPPYYVVPHLAPLANLHQTCVLIPPTFDAFV